MLRKYLINTKICGHYSIIWHKNRTDSVWSCSGKSLIWHQMHPTTSHLICTRSVLVSSLKRSSGWKRQTTISNLQELINLICELLQPTENLPHTHRNTQCKNNATAKNMTWMTSMTWLWLFFFFKANDSQELVILICDLCKRSAFPLCF